jgi:hypothetical protein
MTYDFKNRGLGHRSVGLMERQKKVRSRTLWPRLIYVSSNGFANISLKWKLLDAAVLSASDGKSSVLPIEIRKMEPYRLAASQSVEREQREEGFCTPVRS